MNKQSIALFSSIIVSAGVLSACGGDDTQNGSSGDQSSSGNDQKQEQPADSIETVKAKEPTKNDTCYYCEMGIPHPGEEGAVFTAQAITEEGERIYFDDSGCLENAEAEQDFAKVWVKDYESNEWVKREGTTVVYDESLKTPMSYHYAIFTSEEDAQAYVDENEAELASWDAVEEDAAKRAKGKDMDMDMDKNHDGMGEDEHMDGDEHMDEDHHEHSDEDNHS